MTNLIIVIISSLFSVVAFSKDPCASFFKQSLQVQAKRLGGPVIPPWFVPGWKAIFNGTVIDRGNGNLTGIFRMARRNYNKNKDNSVRGYTLTNYISDIGEFSSQDYGDNWKFEGVVVANAHGLKDHIKYLEKIYSLSLEEAAEEKVLRAINSLKKIDHSGPLTDGILEDPRYIEVRDSEGKMRHFLFVTDVPLELLLGPKDFSKHKIYHKIKNLYFRVFKSSFSKHKTYQMGAIEITFKNKKIEILDYFRFGPYSNKDSWIINTSGAGRMHDIHRKIKKIYSALGRTYYGSRYPVLVSTRIRGSIQVTPFASMQEALEITPKEWGTIFENPELYETIVAPDGQKYNSVGNNDQPFPVYYKEIDKLWHFYHKTTADELIQYETWVQILDGAGKPLYRLPYPLQRPVQEFELGGDIDHVVFNSGHFRKDQHTLVHVNGAADNSVSLSANDEKVLLKEIKKFPVE